MKSPDSASKAIETGKLPLGIGTTNEELFNSIKSIRGNFLMDAIEQAMQMEKDGEVFYRELAEKATEAGFREIFNQLANDEVKHYHIFKNMRGQQVPFTETRVLKDAANIFKQMIARDVMKNLDPSQLELYEKAMELERNSQKYYLAQADEITDQDQSELFRKIAGEEERHFFLLHNIYELVLRPLVWVENGEFVHLEDY